MNINYINKKVYLTLKNDKLINGLVSECTADYIRVGEAIINSHDIENIREYSNIEYKVDEYLNYIDYERRLSRNTHESYKNDLDKYKEYLNENKIKDVNEITKEKIKGYLEFLSTKEELDTKSIARKLTAIKGFHAFLCMKGYTTIDVSSTIERPKLRKSLPKVLTVEEVNKLLDINPVTTFDYRDKAMLELLYATGLRISELLNLTMNDIDLENCIVRCMGKGSKERMIPIGEYVIDSMTNYLEKRPELYIMKRDNHIFLNNHGLMLSRSGFFKMLKHRLKVCDIHVDVSPHTLRHSFATHMIESGSDLRVVQELLGHSDISTTRIYTHISNQKVRKDYEDFHPRSKK